MVNLSNDLCSAEGCENEAGTRGMCHTHYMQWYRAQDDVIKGLMTRATEEAGNPATEEKCYWCDIYDGVETPAVTWFMDEAACRQHLHLGKRWATYALRLTS